MVIYGDAVSTDFSQSVVRCAVCGITEKIHDFLGIYGRVNEKVV
jgi:hypothetical protein